MPDHRHIVCTHPRNGVVVVTFTAVKMFDSGDIQDLGEELFGLVEGSSAIILDFTSVNLFSTSVLNKLIRLQAALAANQGRLFLCGLSEGCMEVFRVTQLHKKFKIYPNAPQALAAA